MTCLEGIRKKVRGLLGVELRHLVGNSTWTITGTAVSSALLMAETILIARFLSPELFGLFVLITTYPETLLQVLDFRVREVLTKFLAEFTTRDEGALAVALIKLLWLFDVGVGVLAFGLVSATATLATKWFMGHAEVAPLIILYGLGLMFAALDSASGSILRVYDRYALAFTLATVANVIRFLLLLVAVVWARNLGAVILGRVLSEITATLMLGTASFLVIKRSLWPYRNASISSLRGRFKEIFGFLFHTNLSATFKTLTSKLDALIIGIFWPPAVVGIYKMATKLASTLLLISDPLYIAVFPHFAKRYAASGDNPRVLPPLGLRLTLLLAPLLGLVILSAGLPAKQLIVTILGPAYLQAVDPFRIMLVGFTLPVLFFWGRAALLSSGRADALTKSGLLAGVTHLTLLLLFLPHWGAIGGAVALTAQNAVFVGLQLYFLGRQNGWKIQWQTRRANSSASR